MPVLGHKDIQRHVLPSTKHLPEDQQGWVEIDPNITADVLVATEHVGSNTKRTIAMLAKAIVNWNYTDEDGNTAKIDNTSVGQLPIKDVKYLEDLVLKAVEDERGLDNEEKKDSSAT